MFFFNRCVQQQEHSASGSVQRILQQYAGSYRSDERICRVAESGTPWTIFILSIPIRAEYSSQAAHFDQSNDLLTKGFVCAYCNYRYCLIFTDYFVVAFLSVCAANCLRVNKNHFANILHVGSLLNRNPTEKVLIVISFCFF